MAIKSISPCHVFLFASNFLPAICSSRISSSSLLVSNRIPHSCLSKHIEWVRKINSLEEDTFLNIDSAPRNHHISPIQATQPNVWSSVGDPINQMCVYQLEIPNARLHLVPCVYQSVLSRWTECTRWLYIWKVQHTNKNSRAGEMAQVVKSTIRPLRAPEIRCTHPHVDISQVSIPVIKKLNKYL